MFKNFLLPRLLPRSVFQINPGMIRNLDFLLVGNFTHSDSVVEAIGFFMDHPEFFEERRTGLMLPMPEKLHIDQFDFAAMFSNLLLLSQDDFLWDKKRITSGSFPRSAMKANDFIKLLGPEWGVKQNRILLLERNPSYSGFAFFPEGWQLKTELESPSLLANPRNLERYLSRQLRYGLRLNSLRERFRLEITHQGRVIGDRRFYLSPAASVLFLFLLMIKKSHLEEASAVSWSDFRILIKNNAALYHRIEKLLRPGKQMENQYQNLENIDEDRSLLERNLSEAKTVSRAIWSGGGSFQENGQLEISESARSSVFWPEILHDLKGLLREKLRIEIHSND
jgi:hypothetical protein